MKRVNTVSCEVLLKHKVNINKVYSNSVQNPSHKRVISPSLNTHTNVFVSPLFLYVRDVTIIIICSLNIGEMILLYGITKYAKNMRHRTEGNER